jgi:hypothetical protein
LLTVAGVDDGCIGNMHKLLIFRLWLPELSVC